MVQQTLFVIVGLAIAGASIIVMSLGSMPYSDKNNLNSNGHNLPQESRGIKIDIVNISGSPQAARSTNEAVTELGQGHPVNITAIIVNTNNSSFSFGSFTQGFTVYDSSGKIVMRGDITQDMTSAITLEEAESLELTHPWNLKINTHVNSEPHFVDAPAGRYTIYMSFAGGGIEIADGAEVSIQGKI